MSTYSFQVGNKIKLKLKSCKAGRVDASAEVLHKVMEVLWFGGQSMRESTSRHDGACGMAFVNYIV